VTRVCRVTRVCEKIVTQPILCQNQSRTFVVEKKLQKNVLLLVKLKKKLLRVNNRPICENSSNLVTLSPFCYAFKYAYDFALRIYRLIPTHSLKTDSCIFNVSWTLGVNFDPWEQAKAVNNCPSSTLRGAQTYFQRKTEL
jgi:hypothetical protein